MEDFRFESDSLGEIKIKSMPIMELILKGLWRIFILQVDTWIHS